MALNSYVGPEGGDWFDPANWSAGVVPGTGDIARIFYGVDGPRLGPAGPDAGGGTLSGLTIDLDTGNPTPIAPLGTLLVRPTFDLVADQIGTAAAPVTIDISDDGSTGGQTTILSFSTLNGSIDVGQIKFAVVVGDAGAGGTTINGGIETGYESTLVLTGSSDGANRSGAAPVFTINGQVDLGEAGDAIIDASRLDGTGSIDLGNGSAVVLVADPSLPAPVDTLSIGFTAGASGILYADQLTGGYGGTITGFGVGDTIVGDSRGEAGDTLTTSFANDALTVTDQANGSSQVFHFAGIADPSFFQIRPEGDLYYVTYGLAETFGGPQGGNWFDGTNWNEGTVPGGDVTARLYDAHGVDATAGTITASIVDLSASFTDAGTGTDGRLIDPVYNLVAGTVGTRGARDTLIVTSNAGAAADAALTCTTLYSAIEVTQGQRLTIGVTGAGLTIDSDPEVDSGSTLAIVDGDTGDLPDAIKAAASSGAIEVGGTLFVGVDAWDPGAALIDLDRGGRVDIANADRNGIEADILFDASPTDVPSTQILDVTGNAGGYAGEIGRFVSPGDEILATLAQGDGSAPIVTYANDVLTVTQSGASGPDAAVTFHIDGAGGTFDVVRTGSDTIEITYAPCFAQGTSIATPGGAVRVEDLRAGDTVTTLGGGTSLVRWMGHRRLHRGRVVRFAAGSLPVGPERALFVSEDHAMFVDGCLVPAALLVDGAGITLEAREVVTLWHVELETHAVLLAEGAPAESYLDTGNRTRFANCALGYDPVSAVGDPCAPMVLAGAGLERIRSMLPVLEGAAV